MSSNETKTNPGPLTMEERAALERDAMRWRALRLFEKMYPSSCTKDCDYCRACEPIIFDACSELHGENPTAKQADKLVRYFKREGKL
ncbi:hypothetical protein OAF54_01080 [bacterium]|nr:hypothetical protein [bacterium]